MLSLGSGEDAEVAAVTDPGTSEVTAQAQRLQGEPSNCSETGFVAVRVVVCREKKSV